MVGPSRTALHWTGTVVVLGSLWLILINQLRLDWEINPQYGYGWLVPLLTGYLFWSRWPSRPAPEPCAGWWPLALASIAAALAFFPTRVVREAAPDWSGVSWALALEIVFLTLAAVACMGGWKSLRHFAAPICFFLMGVAWPPHLEVPLTQGLMHQLTALTAELLGWGGISATAHGNLLRLRTGFIGVDEACSGVRSLQSMLMASLFLGELYRFNISTRCGVVLAGLAIALFFNIVRALFLVTLAIRHGIGALEKWHDPAGFSILAASFLTLFVLVNFLKRPLPVASEPRRPWRPLPAAVWMSALAWLALVELATEGWYRSHESANVSRQGWAVRWPATRPGFQERPIASTVRSTLAFSEGREAEWTEPDASRWLMFAFKWRPGRTSTVWARQHRPEICLPGGGSTLLAEYPAITIAVGELRIPFRFYEFDHHGEPLHVFFCLWEVANRDFDRHLGQDSSRESKLQRVATGQRNLGQQSLEVIIAGLGSRAAAEAAFRAQMQACLIAAPE